MNSQIQIRQLLPEEWKRYREIRLKALQDVPLAFSKSYEEEVNKTKEEWQKWLIESEENIWGHKIFAIDGDKAIGMMTVFRENKIKIMHKATIAGVYLSSEYRGKGIAQLLFNNILEWCKNKQDIKKIQLGVNSKNIPAIKFYEKNGFKIVGALKDEIKYTDKYYDEYIMELYL